MSFYNAPHNRDNGDRQLTHKQRLNSRYEMLFVRLRHFLGFSVANVHFLIKAPCRDFLHAFRQMHVSLQIWCHGTLPAEQSYLMGIMVE